MILRRPSLSRSRRLTPAFKSMPSNIPHSREWAPPALPSFSAAASFISPTSETAAFTCCAMRSILRLTRDHSYVGRLVESGIVRAEDAEKHPQRHILTAALGAGRELAVDAPNRVCPCSRETISCSVPTDSGASSPKKS